MADQRAASTRSSASQIGMTYPNGQTSSSPVKDPGVPTAPRHSRDGEAIILELQSLNRSLEASAKSRARDVAKGVFFGALALLLLGLMLRVIIQGLFEMSAGTR